MFRDENEASQKNSERARREVREGKAPAMSFDVLPSQVLQEQHPQASTHVVEPGLLLQYPWLSDRALAEVPGPLKRDVETRAVARFFVNWTLYPGNDGVVPGHMHDLYPLYLSAPPGSVLWLAVRAVACADMRHESVGDTPFHIKARQYYGAALNGLRVVAHEEHRLASDQVLAAILLIDNFEKMYLARIGPLGPHRDAIKHILHSGGNDYLFNQSSFALGCLAHKRLQARQILLREEPDPEQIMWVSKLNVDQPDIHITADVLHMNILFAAAKKLTESGEEVGSSLEEKVEQSTQLAHSIQNLIASIESWTSAMTGLWKPEVTDPQQIAQPREMDEPFDLPIPHFPYARMLSYHNLWLGCLWNFHAASQIVLRESLVDVINYGATIHGREPDRENMERIHTEQEAVDKLSSVIMWSIPLLLGFTRRYDSHPRSPPPGKMVGRLFCLCSMWVIQKARFTSLEHKQTASEVTKWINDRYRLG
ncbi:hypothetical protein, variant [Cladophialophora immunda]|nr:hypothetical protein, variant [Cladophialophora immunda]KIW26162.1 hypothetical protein, variant [Cladophialophora immunda]